MTRKRPPWPRLLVLVASIGGSVVSLQASADELTNISGSMWGWESEGNALLARKIKPELGTYDRGIKARIAGAEYEVLKGETERATQYVSDVARTQKDHPGYPEALLVLGDVYLKNKDYSGAKLQYSEVVQRNNEPSFAPFLQHGLVGLIETAIRSRNLALLDPYMEQIDAIPADKLQPTTLYYRAKYYYFRALQSGKASPDAISLPSLDAQLLQRARAEFSAIAAGKSFYVLHAQYFLGVIELLNAQVPEALSTFSKLAQEKPQHLRKRELVDYARIAVARIHMEAAEYEEALAAYLSVSPKSKHFDESLYERAWALQKLDKTKEAVAALDNLLKLRKQSSLVPAAELGRGELWLRDRNYEEARKGYDLAHGHFDGLYQKMVASAGTQTELATHFQQLAKQQGIKLHWTELVPQETWTWFEEDEDFTTSLKTLGDAQSLEESFADIKTLLGQLHALEDRSDDAFRFRDLREERFVIDALLNRAQQLRRRLVNFETQRPSSVVIAAQSAHAERVALEPWIAKLPVDSEEAAMAWTRVSLKRDQLEATIGKQTQTQGEASTTVRVLQEDLRNLAQEFAKIQAELAGHAELRGKYAQAVKSELSEARPQLDVKTQPMHAKLEDLEMRLTARNRDLDAIAAKRWQDLILALEEEEALLASRGDQQTADKGEAETMLGHFALRNFRHIQAQLDMLVAQAKYGSLTVSWNEREEHIAEVSKLSQQRANELRQIDNEYKDVADVPAGGAP